MARWVPLLSWVAIVLARRHRAPSSRCEVSQLRAQGKVGLMLSVRTSLATILGAVLGAGCHKPPPPPTAELHVVNTSKTGDIDILLDGSVIATGVPRTMKEDRAAARTLQVPSGRHTLEAKDRTGNVLDTQSVDLAERQYLFVPARDPTICFGIRTDTYDTAASAPFRGPTGSAMDPTHSFWELPVHVDSWWRPNPKGVKSGGKGGAVKKNSMRQFLCGTSILQLDE